MADNERACDPDGQRADSNKNGARYREQRASRNVKRKAEEELPAPPPDPWNRWRSGNSPNQNRNLDEDEDIIAYLANIGEQTPECPSRSSATATSNLCVEDAFEHLDRLCAFAEQILELRNRNSRLFKRVRNLERLKVLRNANNKLENAYARDKDAIYFREEDTGFAESLLDAMLSTPREGLQKRNVRSSSTRPTREKFDIDKQTSLDEISGNPPKVSKWTRVKAAFKWERAYTNDTDVDPTIATTTTIPLLSLSNKYHRVADEGRESNTVGSSLVSEPCSLSLPCRPSSASSSNDGSYDYSPKPSHLDDHPLKRKDEDNVEDTSRLEQPESINEVVQGRPLIRITSEKDETTELSNEEEKDGTGSTPKRSTPTLTITIPPQEEDIRYTSSSEANSPLLPLGASASGGSSPQFRRLRDPYKDFKRQQSFGVESVILSSKMQRQDSKWNKVRRAFLTNSTLSVPSNLINIVPRHTLFHDGLESSANSNYDESSEKNSERTTQSDYRALREKTFGTDFEQKLIEWERLKNSSPRPGTKETSFNLSAPRDSLLPEEKLTPEFRKKLQDWKRAKKMRRGSAPFEQQRIGRRRLTDWQLWRSPSKTDYRNNKETTGSSRGNFEFGDNVNDERKTQLHEEFARKIESWKRLGEIGSQGNDAKQSVKGKLHSLRNVAGIDESEFLTLEKSLALFNNDSIRRRDSDAQQLYECFDGCPRSHACGTQNVNDTNEIFVRTSVGSYRFEGISREFTRKLYDWERYRGISPTSSTFRLLGPAYMRETATETSPDDSSTIKDRNEESTLFKLCAPKRSKSVGNLAEKTTKSVPNEYFTRRANSLQALDRAMNRAKNSDRLETSASSTISVNRRRKRGDVALDIMDDSEPEAMIVDIEDVIEETASPLERVQPHQTPVYSVAASETTSIAVPLGTVTSSHEPSPVCLVQVEENSNSKHWGSESRWKQRKSFSSEDSLVLEQLNAKRWDKRNSICSNADSDRSSSHASLNKQRTDLELDKDSLKSNSSFKSMEEAEKVGTENAVDSGIKNDIVSNKYEEVVVADPRYCSLMNVRSATKYNEGFTKSLVETSNICKSDENRQLLNEEKETIVQDENRSHRLKEDHEKSIKKCDEKSAEDSLVRGYRREPTIHTTAYTVVPSREERCVERIVINEETLNKIVVPTACCMEKGKNPAEVSVSSAPINQETVKKKSSPTRNVFVRTKRIIFSPFRRSEEENSRKESNTSENEVLRRNKSKSRSGSPKINRQDALLRMSLSLPWPLLRPSSKDSKEVKESQPENRSFERCKSVENTRKLSNGVAFESNNDVRRSSEVKSFSRDKRGSASVETTANDQRKRCPNLGSSLPSLTIEEKKICPKFDPQSSELIHKLAILSNAVAKRDGRGGSNSEDTSPVVESHSLRVRRAKQDFLSRRGGPLCHSTSEPNDEAPTVKTCNHYYEPIFEKEKSEGKMTDASYASNSGETETSNGGEEDARQVEVKNERNSAVVASRPDRVKSASAGMINLDPDAFVHLTEASRGRGCESLPRSISKQQQPLGSLAKIVNKFKFARLIRNKDDEGNMSTISKLCRQSLLIDVRNDFEKCWESEREEDSSKSEKVKKTKY